MHAAGRNPQVEVVDGDPDAAPPGAELLAQAVRLDDQVAHPVMLAVGRRQARCGAPVSGLGTTSSMRGCLPGSGLAS